MNPVFQFPLNVAVASGTKLTPSLPRAVSDRPETNQVEFLPGGPMRVEAKAPNEATSITVQIHINIKHKQTRPNN